MFKQLSLITTIFLLISSSSYSQSTVLKFKYYNSYVSFYESDIDSWFSEYSKENTTLNKQTRLAHKEFINFKSKIIDGNAKQRYLEVDNLRYFRLPVQLGHDYYFGEGTDNYKTRLKNTKDKKGFKVLMKVRESIINGFIDIIVESGKKLSTN